jgi:PAS domain S-box-containing protein
MEAARAELEVARTLDDATLIDSLPKLLDNLIEALTRGESDATVHQSAAIGAAHGRQRAKQTTYTLNDLLVEYRLLSSAIFSALRGTVPLNVRTEDLIIDWIHRGIGNASAEFMRVRESAEAAARAVTGSLAEGIFTIDADGKLTSINPAAERMLGWSEAEILGKDLHETIHPPHNQPSTGEGRCRILQVLETGVTTRTYDDVFRRKDGTWFPVALSSSPVKQCGITKAAVAFHDISELKRINEAQEKDRERLRQEHAEIKRLLSERTGELDAAQQQLQTLYDGVLDYAIFALDPQGYIMTWNRGATHIKQYTADEAIGSHFSMLYTEEGRIRNEPMGHLRTAAIEGRFRGEGVRRKKSGELFLADVLITPMYRNGELVGYSKVVQDLSERHALLQERDLSRIRVEALENQQRLRETFVAGLAHDLRNPLSAAAASMQIIMRSACNNDRHLTVAARALQNIQRADLMLSDILDASRADAGARLSIRIEQCDLVAIAREAVAELVTVHGDRFVITPDSPVVGHWDGAALKRVIENLTDNAVKYGDSRTPVTIALDVVKDRVLLKVHNFGDAIRPEDRPLIFEQFRRGPSASKRSGWGIGLTLVRAIAEAHGGIVKVESYPKEGTTFTVDLPLDARKAQAPQQPGQMVD